MVIVGPADGLGFGLGKLGGLVLEVCLRASTRGISTFFPATTRKNTQQRELRFMPHSTTARAIEVNCHEHFSDELGFRKGHIY
jgi:hypothetical protein